MTQKQREDRFIEQCKKDFGTLTWESELLLRHGYSAGATELGHVAYDEGMREKQSQILGVIGASPRKEQSWP